MIDEVDLFRAKDPKKDHTVTLRVSKNQKKRLYQLAGNSGISAFIISLIGQYERQIYENERQLHGSDYDVFADEDLPF